MFLNLCKVFLYRLLVTEKSGEERELFFDSENSGGHSLAKEWTKNPIKSITIQTISLEDLLNKVGFQSVDLLKCDIEGAEYEVFLSTSPDVLKRIHAVIMEVHLSLQYPPDILKKLISYFQENGFSCSLNHEIPETLNEKRAFILKAEQKTS